MKSSELALFCKRLSFMIKSGISVSEALKIYSKHSPKKYWPYYKQLSEQFDRGSSLSSAIEQGFLKVPKTYCTLIRSGEQTGSLGLACEIVAEVINSQRKLKTKIVSALLYPCIILALTIGLTSFLLIYIFPKMIPLLKNLHVTLPWNTRLLLWLEYVIANNWLYIIGIITLTVIGIHISLKYKAVRSFIDYWLLNIPLISSLVKYAELVAVFRNLNLMQTAGLTITDALHQLTCTNTVYNQFLKDSVQDVHAGQSFADTLAQQPLLFPTPITPLIATAELTSSLSETCHFLSDYFKERLEEQLNILTKLFEPILLIMMGLMVGSIALSLLLPLYQVSQHING